MASASSGKREKGGSPLAVGMLRAKSRRLSADGVFIAVFHKRAWLCFQGCVQFRLLAGLIQVHGHVVKPSPHFHELYSPMKHCTLVLTVMDYETMDQEFRSYCAPFRKQPVWFRTAKEADSRTDAIELDLEAVDVKQLNALVGSRMIQNVAAIGLFKRLSNHLSVTLEAHGWPLLDRKPQLIEGFHTLTNSSLSALETPPIYRMLAWNVIQHQGAVVLVCGGMGTGKSTLCRFLVNYMLNRYPAVAFIECDVGQTEFTVPGVLSLHILTKAVIGPPYTHLRDGERAYYYGDKTPSSNPVSYIGLIRALFDHFKKEVRPRHPDIPLVINTCGWLSDMGVPLFLDIIRSLHPSHIIRLLYKQQRTVESVRELCPLTSEFLKSTPGLVTKARMEGVTAHVRGGEDGSRSATPTTSLVLETQLSSGESSEEEMDIFGSGSSEEDFFQGVGCGAELLEDGGEGWRQLVRRQRYQRQLKLRRMAEEHHAYLTESRFTFFSDWLGMWRHVGPHLVCTLNSSCGKGTSRQTSQENRQLALLAYFSPLLPRAEEVGNALKLPHPQRNILSYAPPLEIPWNDVAVHVLHEKVPNSQILYAMNGKFVALGCVDPSELVDHSSQYPGMVKFLKSVTPFIEFLGLGLLRGIDPERKLFFVTTPESGERLQRVNVLVLGNSDPPDSLITGETTQGEWPYYIKGFRHCRLAAFWIQQ